MNSLGGPGGLNPLGELNSTNPYGNVNDTGMNGVGPIMQFTQPEDPLITGDTGQGNWLAQAGFSNQQNLAGWQSIISSLQLPGQVNVAAMPAGLQYATAMGDQLQSQWGGQMENNFAVGLQLQNAFGSQMQDNMSVGDQLITGQQNEMTSNDAFASNYNTEWNSELAGIEAPLEQANQSFLNQWGGAFSGGFGSTQVPAGYPPQYTASQYPAQWTGTQYPGSFGG